MRDAACEWASKHLKKKKNILVILRGTRRIIFFVFASSLVGGITELFLLRGWGLEGVIPAMMNMQFGRAKLSPARQKICLQQGRL